MGFSSCTDIARFFTKTQCCSQAEAYPALGNGKNTFQKKRQVRSTDVAVLLVSSSGEELKAAHRRAKLQNLHWGLELMRQKIFLWPCCTKTGSTTSYTVCVQCIQNWVTYYIFFPEHASPFPQPFCGVVPYRVVQENAGKALVHSSILPSSKSSFL